MCLHCLFSTALSGNVSSLCAVFVMFFPFILAASILMILTYVFSALPFFKFIKSRKLKYAFLSWIPILDVYNIGKVYDDINKKSGKKTNFKFILTVVNSLFFVVLTAKLFHTPMPDYVLWSLLVAILIIKLICFRRILKEYVPDDLDYFVITLIFSIIPIFPFIPGRETRRLYG